MFFSYDDKFFKANVSQIETIQTCFEFINHSRKGMYLGWPLLAAFFLSFIFLLSEGKTLLVSKLSFLCESAHHSDPYFPHSCSQKLPQVNILPPRAVSGPDFPFFPCYPSKIRCGTSVQECFCCEVFENSSLQAAPCLWKCRGLEGEGFWPSWGRWSQGWQRA